MLRVKLCWVVILSVAVREIVVVEGGRPWLLQRMVGLLEFV